MQSRLKTAITTTLTVSLLGATVLPVAASGSYVKDGVWYQTGADGKAEEVALFGANYSLPFAFGYRSVKAMGLSHQDAIRMDVAHLARLGVTAYRIHLWDRLISDRDGNLLNNEHLKLFDFLLSELKRYNIKAVVTPIGWWGSGYPAPDPIEPGFSVLYSKNQMNEKADAISAQKRYLAQLMAHKNLDGVPYAKDPNILAFELFNEPKHADAGAVTGYVNGLIKVMRDAGVTKPLFYNSSEQGNWPEFAKALCESNIDGVSFQWYPTGLLKFSSLQSNVLGSVAQYHNPFENVAACAGKARMIYEFDAADVTAPVLYPAMARSFRRAGFQWATQFAYDPAALAASNAEYNTHYLNLLYTPAKAISFLIAGEVFRNLPRGADTGVYPASNQFGGAALNTTLDPATGLALLNNGSRYYHSNSTNVVPVDAATLSHIAGVGSSPLVQYQGSGAYFLDKQQDGLWQLEVYPDATQLDDPHQNSSLKREAVRLSVSQRDIRLKLADLGQSFVLQRADGQQAQAQNGTVSVQPGRYVVAKNTTLLAKAKTQARPFLLPEIAAQQPLLVHQPLRQWPIDQLLPVCGQLSATQLTGNFSSIKVSLFYRLSGEGQVQQQALQAEDLSRYCTKLKLPANSGMLQYQLVATVGATALSFPGPVAALPSDWDFPQSSAHSFTTLLQQPGAAVPLFDARVDQTTLLYPKDAQVTQQWLAGERQQGLTLRLRPAKTPDWQQPPLPLLRTETHAVMGLTPRDLSGYTKVAIKMRAVKDKLPVRFALLNKDGLAFGIDLEASSEWRYQLVPLSALQAKPTLLTQAYPTFMPAQLSHQGQSLGDLSQLQGTQWQLLAPSDGNNALEIAEVSLMR
ncbi:hypothetical protein [Rheinheimera tilapiae]|uniref:Glycoside hydrolase family 5 domain-containing protein n=1 Tax=Rheinheimera tilapiae TaxID=875043 RepID=A0ABV6BBB3_9GAMM